MRLSYVLLVSCVAALLAPSNVVAESPSVPTVVSPEQVAGARNEGNDRRLLRSHETPEEERLNDDKLKLLVAGKGKKLFKKWNDKGLSVTTVSGKLNKVKHGLTDAQLSQIVNRYRPYRGEGN
ncbi:hypothetical protein PR002_g5546 [Phytophthora rubi]|uniref:RxLR effector protein n=1 Tax=Phytophthora rubi TaxID=129364 RepID=A0A6A3N1I6_9STRA|nr:hypothetical protein PR002_g5546 [Phytophthora rubi]